MTSSLPFQIRYTQQFERSYAKLRKAHFKSERQKEEFRATVTNLIKSIAEDPNRPGSRDEPWPHGASEPTQVFKKITFRMPGLRGAAGEGRLMYLVDREERILWLIWIYTHEEFQGRPGDREIRDSIVALREARKAEQEENEKSPS